MKAYTLFIVIGSCFGYQVGGSLHIIANNNIGFTTETYDSRSTTYSSDPAKGFEIPIFRLYFLIILNYINDAGGKTKGSPKNGRRTFFRLFISLE